MTGDYNIPATAALAERGIPGREALRKIDAYLGGRGPSDQIVARTVALDIEVSEPEVTAALDGYVNEGILSKETMIQCSICGTSETAELVSAARASDDEYPCPGGCESDLAADRDALELIAYTPEHELPKAG